MTQSIKQITELNIGESFKGFLLVKSVIEGTARNGAPFLNTSLGDASGEIKTMVWHADDEKKHIFTSGNIVHVDGSIIEFQGSKQLSLQDFRLKDDADPIDVTDLLVTAPMKGDDLFSHIVLEVSNFKNETLKAITLEILTRYAEELKTHPAAKSVHHAYVAGLAYHTYSMMNLGKEIARLYPVLQKDLLLAGIILHDIGKTIEYEGFIQTDVTLEGKLKGHISIMSEEIGRIARELDVDTTEEALLLQHMVLSHHGLAQNGWGSPVSPQIIEAHILHQIDMMDAGMDSYRNAVKNTEEGEFTDRIFGLDNRAFYVPTI